jgi:dihydroorotase
MKLHFRKIFSSTSMLIAVHCEDDYNTQFRKYKEEYGEDIPYSPPLNPK